MGRKVSFAKVMSVIAVFIALGGAAYAGKKINGKTIKNHSIPAKKLKPGVLTGLDKCGTKTVSRVGDVCYSAERPGLIYYNALRACVADGLSLPSPGVAMLVVVASGTPAGQRIWSDTYIGGVEVLTVSSNAGGSINTDNVGTTLPFRCVSSPTN